MLRAWRWFLPAIAVGAVVGLDTADLQAACCYFTAKNKDIQQPGQKVFITWNPTTQVETFTVQPKFEGNARDFGMVIPTPSKPRLNEMPRDFFKMLAIYTILKERKFPRSKLINQGGMMGFGGGMMGIGGMAGMGGGMGGFGGAPVRRRPPAVKVVETGVVGSLDYKIIEARRADDLFRWLKNHKYKYSGDEASLDHYVQKKWFFTVMKIDTAQMKRNKSGVFVGEVTPTRFQFTTSKLVYPLKITQLSVKDRTEALFYVQAPTKVDLPKEMTYQYQWVPLLQQAQGAYQKGVFGGNQLPTGCDAWLKAIDKNSSQLLQDAKNLGFGFTSGRRPRPNEKGRIPTTLEWAKQLTKQDILVLVGRAPFSERVPNVDMGVTFWDLQHPQRAEIASLLIRARLSYVKRHKPGGFLVRQAPAKDLRQLKILAGHLEEGQFLTKFRKTFTKAEMADDLLIIPAKVAQSADKSEYEEILPTSPP